jgi:hypothetical protein
MTRCSDCAEPITASLWILAEGTVCLTCYLARIHATGEQQHPERKPHE